MASPAYISYLLPTRNADTRSHTWKQGEEQYWIQRTPSNKSCPEIHVAQITNKIITVAFYLRWKHLGQVYALNMFVSTCKSCCKAKNNSKWSFKHWTCCCRELFPPKEFKNGFSEDAWSQLVPFSPETPIWKGRCQSDHFGFLGFPSNPALHAAVSNCVSGHVDTPSSKAGKHYITLSLVLQLGGEPEECWSQTECPKTGAHHQLLRDL